ncbi:hypothetical protein ACHAL6_12325 [Proteiniclasticum sp. C24MP]|uniref:baeRF3 domain-containing protein n=1 Tax=Proteiniclasticum sp. C24MP TaxID=3374101 RepID=UPI0037553FB6
MTYIVAERFPHPIIEKGEAPLVSIYLPTSRLTTESKNNEIRFKNLLKKVESKLLSDYPGKKGEKILSDLKDLAEDKKFWANQLDGLGVLATSEDLVVYKLQRDVMEYVEVSDTFYIKPLLNAYQTDDSFQILALNKNDFTLYEGNRYALRKVDLPEEEQKSLKDVVGYFTEDNHMQGSSVGLKGSARFGYGGSSRDEEAIDVEKFFRWVDRYVTENHSKKTEVPLILATLPENHTEFAKISHNDYLSKEGIKKDPQSLNEDELRKMAWAVLEPDFNNRIEKLNDQYELSKSRELASEDISEIARAAMEGRVESLMVNLNKTIPGRIDPGTDKLLMEKESGDMLNDLTLLALKQSAKVYVVTDEKLSLDTGVKAIYRYQKE